MGCETHAIPGGYVVACTRGGRRAKPPKLDACAVCGTVALIQCDYPVPAENPYGRPRQTSTCDRWLCLDHAIKVGPNVDYCPEHYRVREEASAT